jgi:2-polyprenyl-3-methyl-5-hydroxy-6-metoxy-1,4-benzoquinol methylase
MDLRESWEAHAAQWIAWARAPGHDGYWRFHRDQFLRLLPQPGKQTIDVGCGEGRLTRHLKELGHHVVGLDASPSLVAAARELDSAMDVLLADAAAHRRNRSRGAQGCGGPCRTLSGAESMPQAARQSD